MRLLTLLYYTLQEANLRGGRATEDSATPAAASRRERPDASHYNHDSDSTNGSLEEPITMPANLRGGRATEDSE